MRKGQVVKCILVFVVLLSACTANQDVLKLECEQNVGEACNKLGQAVEKSNKAEAEVLYQRGCDLNNTNSCVRLADMIKGNNLEKAYKVLKGSCDRGNTAACVKQAEILQENSKKSN